NVTPDTITAVTIVTQTGDFADGFSQVAPVSGGHFSRTVILTSGRENTVIVIATAGGLTGSAKRVITVIGAAGEDLRFTLTWDIPNDVDLYVRTPGDNGVADTADGHTIAWYNLSADGGVHDVDDRTGT